jgi:hypothetical protein
MITRVSALCREGAWDFRPILETEDMKHSNSNCSAKVTQLRRSNWNLKPGCLEPESMSPTPDTLAPQLYHTPDDLWHVQDCVTHILNVTIPVFSFCVTLSLLGRQQRGEGKCWMSLRCMLVKKDMKVWSWQCPQSVRKGVGDRKAWEIFWLITFYHIL